jgi:hypothetical protein
MNVISEARAELAYEGNSPELVMAIFQHLRALAASHGFTDTREVNVQLEVTFAGLNANADTLRAEVLPMWSIHLTRLEVEEFEGKS